MRYFWIAVLVILLYIVVGLYFGLTRSGQS